VTITFFKSSELQMKGLPLQNKQLLYFCTYDWW